MNFTIQPIENPQKKSELTVQLLSNLPQWFGSPESVKEYAQGVKEHPFYAAFDKGVCIGFFSGKIHYNRTGEIYVCAVDHKYHYQGIGKSLYDMMEKYFKKQKCIYVVVKTLSDIVDYEPYKSTHRFYKSVGFTELITLTEMWDEENPCLIMIKSIG
ncbi:Acetyltransferase, GNAT family [Chitinispirillum alkaliphilum]|nr:Acetyltransferase, GNAT family [Chitinispirillum alkaliphilum]